MGPFRAAPYKADPSVQAAVQGASYTLRQSCFEGSSTCSTCTCPGHNEQRLYSGEAALEDLPGLHDAGVRLIYSTAWQLVAAHPRVLVKVEGADELGKPCPEGSATCACPTMVDRGTTVRKQPLMRGRACMSQRQAGIKVILGPDSSL